MSNIGVFSGDVLSSGIGNRNSSRVLAPPGGGSSMASIFGTDGAAPWRKPQTADDSDSAAGAEPIRESGQHQRNRSTGSRDRFHRDRHIKHHPTDRLSPVSDQNQSTSLPMPKSTGQKVGIASHTEQIQRNLHAGQLRDVHTSSRVLAPPGGQCSNIFG